MTYDLTLAANQVTSTRELSQVMLALAKRGAAGPIIEARDITRRLLPGLDMRPDAGAQTVVLGPQFLRKV